MPDHTDTEPLRRTFPVRLDADMYEAFFQVFPDHGARSLFIRECIRTMLKQLASPDGDLDLPEITKKALRSPALRLRIGASQLVGQSKEPSNDNKSS